ncbi:NERD domain-containing protein [Planomonospora sp. ID67723]|uniref:nuclease-related domain-containing protein n=1 Tax=Planomonospora sp. ID67723 TaxID=2738134 RepID=UPI0018C42057|nr:nuclease-related domain-containing protein [Planomonospora sp. ID67723]MBG0831663.1 NERD domain-containing protein [Planomonospora sp. ID67723]
MSAPRPGLIGHQKDEAVRTWRKGAVGERRTAWLLRPLARRGYALLHDRALPRSRSNVDHMVIGPTGIWVVDSKNWSRSTRVTGRGDGQGGAHQQPPAASFGQQFAVAGVSGGTGAAGRHRARRKPSGHRATFRLRERKGAEMSTSSGFHRKCRRRQFLPDGWRRVRMWPPGSGKQHRKRTAAAPHTERRRRWPGLPGDIPCADHDHGGFFILG